MGCRGVIPPTELAAAVWRAGDYLGERLYYHAECWIRWAEARRTAAA